MRPESPSSELVGRIRALAGDSLEGVVLFGSTARGEARGDSDVDLLIVLSAVSTLRRDLYRQWDAQFGDATPALSPQFVRLPSGAEGAGGIWYEAAIDGVVLWDKAGAVAGRLRDLRKAIAEGRMRRRYLHGHPYWVREAGDLDEKSRAR